MLAILRPLLYVLYAFGLALLGARRRLIRSLQSSGAHDAARAIPLSHRWTTRIWQHRLANAGVIHNAGADRYWLDEPAWHAYRSIRRRRALIIAILLIVALGVSMWRSRAA